jgi:hypothetical protein
MDDPSRSPVPPMTTDHVHEESDVAIRPLALFLVFLVLGLVLVAVTMSWMFGWFLATTNIQSNFTPVIKPPEVEFTAPALQVSPRRDLQLLREREAQILQATEWIDPAQGVVRIPIERAMEVVAERGFPRWPQVDVMSTESPNEQPSAGAAANAGEEAR